MSRAEGEMVSTQVQSEGRIDAMLYIRGENCLEWDYFLLTNETNFEFGY